MSLIAGITNSQAWFVLPITTISLAAIYYVSILQKNVYISHRIFVAIFIIYLLFIYHLLLDPTNVDLVARVFIFIPVSFICLFILPHLIPSDQFLKVISVIAGVVAFVGIPTAIAGEFVPLLEVHRKEQLFDIEVYVIQSVLHNPNPLGELLFFGIIASLIWPKGSSIRRGLISICVLGLVLSQSRAAFLAVGVSIFVYIAGNYIEQNKFQQLLLVCFGSGVVGYLMLLRLIPGPATIEEIYLSGRLNIWHAAIDAAQAQPLIGHGPGDVPTIVGEFSTSSIGAGVYNSFLRLFVTTGIIGGLCYLYLFVYAIVHNLKQTQTQQQLILFSIMVGFIVNELFSGNSIFGLSVTSVIAAMILGYLFVNVQTDSSNMEPANKAKA